MGFKIDKLQKYNNGCFEIKCNKIEDLISVFNYTYDLRMKKYYRGHSKSEEYKLISSIDREYIKHKHTLKEAGFTVSRDTFIHDHLNQFRKKIRGKVDSEDYFTNEQKAWSLGQHYGLLTPFLDWTESPYIAAFFAAINNIEHDGCVYVLDYENIKLMNNESTSNKNLIDLINNPNCDNYNLNIIEPMTNSISRLNAQNGCFTTTPNGIPIDTWIRTFEKYKDEHVLIKIIIPKKIKQYVIYFLHQTNIDYSTIYPDISGICKYCNLNLQIIEKINAAEAKFIFGINELRTNFLKAIDQIPISKENQ